MARSPSRREDRYARDRRDDRGYRRRSRSRDRDRDVRRRRGASRSRSRSPHHSSSSSSRGLTEQQRRYDERDHGRRRDRSRDYRDSKRDRSRERKRSRERSPVRDRRSERDRGGRDAHDLDDRERKRPRREDDSPRHSRRDTSRDRSTRGEESPRHPTAAPSAEEAQLAKLAKVEAWKKKIEEKRRQQAISAGEASPQVDHAATTPASASPAVKTPLTEPASPASVAAAPPSPGQYAGKFDPKAIAKRAAAAMDKQKSALGGDVVIPKSTSSTSNLNGAGVADSSKVAQPKQPNGPPSKPKLTDAKISGFELNKTASSDKTDKPSNALKGAAPLDDEEETEKRKLEKLPDMPEISNADDAALANVEDDQDEEGHISDDDDAEAARETALKRAAEAQAEQQQDVTMTNGEAETSKAVESAPAPAPAPAPASAEAMDVDDEVDPLDAFMETLEKPADAVRPTAPQRGNRDRQVFNSDDEDELEAVGGKDDDIITMAAKRKKKEIPTVNHAKMEYEPFRKSFYSESVEVAEMDDEEVAALRADLDNINCRGLDVPKPIMKWSQGGFGSQILSVIREQKFEKPTSIQCQALPAIMSGRDVIGVAKTGSGKTMAFILPMFRHIKDQRPVENLEGPTGLILAPTRELATQIFRDCKPYLKALNLRGVCAYGGSPIKDQIAELKRGAEVVVCTPGRFIDLLAANSGRVTNLRRVTYVVLDEADRMFDMGFEPQITKILNNVRPQRQTVLFSATFPRSMEALARKALTKPIEILVGGRSVVAPEITQVVEVRGDDTKFLRTLELLGDLHDRDEDARSLIFVERQETADSMFVDLTRKGYPCVSIHGGRDQVDRDAAINDFKAGIAPVMIATSVAARGLDVKQLKLVINFDSPNHIEDYVHRAGRTGRAGNTGTAVTFVTPEQDRFAPFLIRALDDSKSEIPEPLKALEQAHQEKVKAGEGKKVSSGFGGRGIERLDAARDAQRAMEKGKYKTGDEGEDEEQSEDKKKEKDAKEKQVEQLLAKATGGVKDRDAAQAEKPATPTTTSSQAPGLIPNVLNDHLNNAMRVQKAERPDPSAAASKDPLAKVAAAAAGINSRLGSRGTTRSGAAIDNRGPDAGAFHATLEINDFPQKARWGVTNRTNVARILESTGTSITTKGNYYASGTEPGSGEQPKLYILVEGDTEMQVTRAMTDLTRLLKEGTIAAMDSEARAPAGGQGRYSVL